MEKPKGSIKDQLEAAKKEGKLESNEKSLEQKTGKIIQEVKKEEDKIKVVLNNADKDGIDSNAKNDLRDSLARFSVVRKEIRAYAEKLQKAKTKRERKNLSYKHRDLVIEYKDLGKKLGKEGSLPKNQISFDTKLASSVVNDKKLTNKLVDKMIDVVEGYPSKTLLEKRKEARKNLLELERAGEKGSGAYAAAYKELEIIDDAYEKGSHFPDNYFDGLSEKQLQDEIRRFKKTNDLENIAVVNKKIESLKNKNSKPKDKNEVQKKHGKKQILWDGKNLRGKYASNHGFDIPYEDYVNNYDDVKNIKKNSKGKGEKIDLDTHKTNKEVRETKKSEKEKLQSEFEDLQEMAKEIGYSVNLELTGDKKANAKESLEENAKKENSFESAAKTLSERKKLEYEKIGYAFDPEAYSALQKKYIRNIQEARNLKDPVGEKKYKEKLENINNELFEKQMKSSFGDKDFLDKKEKFEKVNDNFAKIRMEAKKLGHIKNILKLVDIESFGQKKEVKGSFSKRMWTRLRNYTNSRDEKNGLVKTYNWATGRGTNKDLYEKLLKVQDLTGKDTTSLTPEEKKLLKSIDLKRLSGSLKEDTTRTSYKGNEITHNVQADFTKKMERIQQIDSRAMKMEGWNIKNRLKIWVENPANIRRLKSKIRIGGTAALLTGGLSNIGVLGSLGMFGARAVGALGGGEIFKDAYKKFATMPYQERAWLMRKEMQKNGDYLENAQAGEIDSAQATKIKRDNFGQMASYGVGALAGTLAGGGLAEMENGGKFLDPTKRFFNRPKKIFHSVKNLFTGENHVKGRASIEHLNTTKIHGNTDLGNHVVKNETKIPLNHNVESTSTPYEDFMENYTVEGAAKIRKGEGIYQALMRQTGNDKAHVMALLKKFDYIKYDSAGKLIKDVRVKDGMGAAYDLVKINGKETIIESIDGSPCYCKDFNVVEVKNNSGSGDLTTGKLERQEYVHSYAQRRAHASVRLPDEVARKYEYLPHQNEISTTKIIHETKYIPSEPKVVYVDRPSEPKTVYVDRYIERPAPPEKITPEVREAVKHRRTRQLRRMEERGEIKVEKKKGRFWNWLGHLGTDVLANEISYQIHRDHHGHEIITCTHPSGGNVEVHGGHNTAHGEIGGGHGTANENHHEYSTGGRRSGNGRAVPNNLDRGRNSVTTQKELYDKERIKLRKQRATRNINSRNRNIHSTQKNTSTKNAGVTGRSRRSSRH